MSTMSACALALTCDQAIKHFNTVDLSMFAVCTLNLHRKYGECEAYIRRSRLSLFSSRCLNSFHKSSTIHQIGIVNVNSYCSLQKREGEGEVADGEEEGQDKKEKMSSSKLKGNMAFKCVLWRQAVKQIYGTQYQCMECMHKTHTPNVNLKFRFAFTQSSQSFV